jgi:phospholipid-translocating ATPase
MIIAIINATFIAMFYFVSIPIYNGWLSMGYGTIFTLIPVYTLIFDEDLDL